MKVRIGIDVGGTFTDAVVIDDNTYELIGSVKIKTTHRAKEGVAAGIVQVLRLAMEKYMISPEDVVFIAHGTTQATNALLEGDVAKVGVVSFGSGIEGKKTKLDTTVGDISLAPGKYLHSSTQFIDTSKSTSFEQSVEDAVSKLKAEGLEAIVASEAFSVDNPKNEQTAVEIADKMGIPATAGNEVSKLYGLKIRTRTAVINASIMPKMLDAANMTEKSIINAGIKAPLMVMRCDGGVMTIDEVRNRPIMTILSGPAAGVAGALMYEKLTDGIFFEVGGTSTDISCVKDGNVIIKYAEVGDHKTYINSLDVRTVGIGGGSMIALENEKIVAVGPRSAHIANLDYEIFADPSDIINPVLGTIKPVEGDAEYAYITCGNGMKFALTLTGAANICGYVKATDYAYGNIEAAKKAWQPLADRMHTSVEEAAKLVMGLSAAKNGKVVDAMIKDYGLDVSALVFVGGGGGAAAVVPHIAEVYGTKGRLAKNAEVISPIGVALAMVRDVVERTISKPTEDDIVNIRQEAFQAAIRSGATPDSIDVKVEVFSKQNLVRATAIGTTELRTKDLMSQQKTEDELRQIVADNLKSPPEKIVLAADNGTMMAFTCIIETKKLFFFTKKQCAVRVIDRDGVIRLQRRNAYVKQCVFSNYKSALSRMVEEHTYHGDGGTEIPNIYLFVGGKMVDLASMPGLNQMIALCDVELAGVKADERVIIVCTETIENERG